jgi:predicted SprT family Zn-dependent metalloprotease
MSGKPHNVSYLYRCRRCGRLQRRGSSAKYCDHASRGGSYLCKGAIERLATIAGPATDPVPEMKVHTP